MRHAARDADEDFRAFAAAAIGPLHRIALGIARDPHTADDLVQTTLEKMYVAWPRLAHLDSPLAYARTTLVRSLVDERRRWWQRQVTTTDAVPERGSLDPGIECLDADTEMRAALARLTARQRAVVVLRHVEGLDVAQTAHATGLSEGSVKSATREALSALRSHLADSPRTPTGAMPQDTPTTLQEARR